MQEGHITLYVATLVLCQAAASTLSFSGGEGSSLMGRRALHLSPPYIGVADLTRQIRKVRLEIVQGEVRCFWLEPLRRTLSHVLENYPFDFVHDCVEGL